VKTRDARQEARLRLARTLRERGDLHALLSRFGAIDQEDGDGWDDVDLVAEVARAHSLSGNATKMEQYFQRCAELNRRRAALYLAEVGWYYQRKKRWARAIVWYDKGLTTFPTYHLGLFRKGYCLERLHRPRGAIAALEAAAASYDGASPEQQVRSRGIQAQVLFHLARSLREIGETDRARASLDRCAEVDTGPDVVIKPEHRLASYGASYLRDGDAARAIATLEEARDRDPRSAVVWERLGLAYALAKRHADAEEALQRAVAFPKGAVALVSLAHFYIGQRRWLEAARALASALERHPQGDVRTRLEMVDLHCALGRPAAAIALLARLGSGRVPPQSTLACAIERKAAEILFAHGDLAGARARVEKACQHDPDDPEALALRDAVATAAASASPPAARSLTDAPLDEEIARLLVDSPVREAGAIASYFSDRGFGFITYSSREQTIFFHVSHVDAAVVDELRTGLPVTFVVAPNGRNGKPQAEDVRIDRPESSAGGDDGDGDAGTGSPGRDRQKFAASAVSTDSAARSPSLR
jgi:tetratricopeptide (TPR) repeat protein